MTLKEGFIEGYVLDSHDASIGLILDNPIDQEEGIAVRKAA